MRTLFVVAVFLVIPSLSCGAECGGSYTESPTGTFTAYDATYECVKAAVDAATDAGANNSGYGNTVAIPAGEKTWANDTNLTITKDIIITGAGKTSTILTDGFTGTIDATHQRGFFYFLPDSTAAGRISNRTTGTGMIKVSGIGFVGTHGKGSGYVHGVYMGDTNSGTTAMRRIKIHDNSFTDLHRAICYFGDYFGVFYDNTVTDTNINYSTGNGQYSYNVNPTAIGNGDAWYFENNVMTTTNTDANISGGGAGMSQVVRYNTWTGTVPGTAHVLEAHGNQPGGIYATQVTEVYGNNFTVTGGSLFKLRGGQSIIFNNVGAASNFVIYEEYSDLISSAVPSNACAENQGVSYQDCSQNCQCQKVHKSYFWNTRATVTGAIRNASIQTDDGSECGISVFDCEDRVNDVANDPLELVVNREFWNHNESYGENADRTQYGVYCGDTLPSKCNVGDGAWITSQNNCSNLTGYIGSSPTSPIVGTLYKCTSQDNWGYYYRPYQYPHPLTGKTCLANCPGGAMSIGTGSVMSIGAGGATMTLY